MTAQALPAGYGLQEYRIEKVALKEYMPGDLASRTADQSITPASGDTVESFRGGPRKS